jgi:ATP-dependent helicase/nuclease subunit B
MSRVNLFTISAGASFADELVRGIIARHGSPENPFELSEAWVLVPTRRAIRTLKEAFERSAAGGIAVLPRIIALGDFDDEEAAVEHAEQDGQLVDTVPMPELPPPISPLRRELLLFTLIQRWSDQQPGDARALGTDRPSIALQLARELARVLDLAASEGLAWDRLRALVPLELARHWEQTLTFLDILGTHWPAILAEEKASDPAIHRDAALRQAARLWRDAPPHHPVIAAGSTGSVPATAEVLHTIAQMPNGAVVLPGLDLTLDDASWEAMGPSHPQHGMAQLLRKFEMKRADVETWAGAPVREPRVRLIAESMRPAATTAAWQTYVGEHKADVARGLEGFSCIVARSPAEEALSIACALREAVETPGKTAALVTPDRNLARRVASELKRWNIAIDDSAGTPLSHTEPGRLLCLMADAVAEEFAPVTLLALLKHPLCCLSADRRETVRGLTLDLEEQVLRGVRPPAGILGLRRKATPGTAAYGLIEKLDLAFGAFGRADRSTEVPLAELLELHRQAAELVSSDAEGAEIRAWQGDAGEAAFKLFESALEAAQGLGLAMDGHDYAAFIREMMEAVAVRPRGGIHPRLAILGPLEARLQQSDLMILGGLNEGKWPPATDPGPWLNRPMRRELDISQPERRIGLSAHDFAQAAASPQVILSRSLKEGGSPTTPSRWLTRLTTLIDGAGLHDRFFDGRLTDIARQLDRPQVNPKPVDAPKPCPPLAARPRGLFVTDVERWVRDPYAIYAKRILRLKPLEPIDEAPGAADRGSAIHKAMELFAKAQPNSMPDDAHAVAELLKLGREAFGTMLELPIVQSVWWPRFERSIRWYVDWERKRRETIERVEAEITGEILFDAPGGPFKLSAKADRLDVKPGHRVAIIDYKTGQSPSMDQIRRGFSPQMTLEAAIALGGGFPGITAAHVDELVYVKLTGAEEGGKAVLVNFKDEVLEDVVHESLARFKAFVASFDNPDQPYLSKPHVLFLDSPGDYDHLARVKEWSSGGGE